MSNDEMTQEMSKQAIDKKQQSVVRRKAYEKMMAEVMESSSIGISTKYTIGEALWEYVVGEERSFAEIFRRYVK